MSNRTERREAERQARKLAYQTLRQQSAQSSAAVAEPQPQESEPQKSQPKESTVSQARLSANRANAQHSSGPVTEEGKAKSSLNSLKHGLTGKAVLLPSEDAAQYQRELDEYVQTYQPATDEELRLVQSLNDCIWRMDRIQRLEIGILLKGDLEFAGKYEDRAARERTLLIQAESYIKYEKQLRNLHIQESRIRRVMEKDRAELLRLQAIRKRNEENEATKPAQPTAAAPNGFVFSTPPQPPASDPTVTAQQQASGQ